MPLSEFEIINKYFKKQLRRHDVVLGIGDDGALLQVPSGMTLVAVVDTLVEGVHFPVETSPKDIGFKALAVNLSDLAAMGAQPAWATLALTMPSADENWLEEFCDGFFSLAEQYNVQLIGGDTTRGPLTVTVQAQGFVPDGQALRRDTAKPDDLIYVTGTLGDAGLALMALQGRFQLTNAQFENIKDKLNRPQARIEQGVALRNLAHAAIDISDGLIADLSHILEASGVGATLTVDAVPVSPVMHSLLHQTGWQVPLAAGDDYELCFTAPKEKQQQIQNIFRQFFCPLTLVGVIDEKQGLRCKLSSGEDFHFTTGGYKHFKS